ncbi:tetratricopeptide repeat protein [Pseudomonas nicosulfuronedens]
MAAFVSLEVLAEDEGKCVFKYSLSAEQEREILLDANRGDLCSAEILASFYYDRRKYSDARHWYERLAEKGSGEAAFEISTLYRNGLLIDGAPGEDNYLLWLRRAAKQGLARAQSELGFYYSNRSEEQGDRIEAMHWYEQAAKQGSADAQFALSELYLVGADDIQFSSDDDSELDRRYQGDKTKSTYWLCQAALNNLPQAQYKLSNLYDFGLNGLPMSQKQEVLWLQKAAENGSVEAKAMLVWRSERDWYTRLEEYYRLFLEDSSGTPNCPQDSAILSL